MPSIVFGKNSVLHLLQSGRAVNQIWFSRQIKRDSKVSRIIDLAKEQKVKYRFTQPNKLNQLAESDKHQGVVAAAAPVQYNALDDILERAKSRSEDPFILLLDELTDPHNLGAIIRSAVAAGVHGIILPKHHSAPVTATVLKVSAGMAEHCLLVRVTNLAQTMDRLKQQGFWFYGADQRADQYYQEPDYQGPIGLVLGSEDRGLRRIIRTKCDFLIRIPMHPPVESLNVSVSAALISYAIAARRGLLS